MLVQTLSTFIENSVCLSSFVRKVFHSSPRRETNHEFTHATPPPYRFLHLEIILPFFPQFLTRHKKRSLDIRKNSYLIFHPLIPKFPHFRNEFLSPFPSTNSLIFLPPNNRFFPGREEKWCFDLFRATTPFTHRS